MKINEERNLPIGFIDSGLGGLSVLKGDNKDNAS